MASADDVAEDLRELADDLPSDIKSASHDGLEETQRVADGLIRSKDIEASGDLRRSGRIVPNDDGGFTLQYGGSAAPHAGLTEFGTGIYFRQSSGEEQFGPYDAPATLGDNLIQGIRDWIDHKGITPRTVETRDELAIVVARSIVGRGTPRQPFILPSWFATKGRIESGVESSFRKSVDNA